MIKLKDFCNSVNLNTTLNVYIKGEDEPTYQYITAYELKQEVPKLAREIGLRYICMIDCLDKDVDMSIELCTG